MALQFAKGTLAINSGATGAHSVSGLSFQPKIVIFFSAATDTTGSYVADEDIMFGAATSSSEEWVIHASSNNQSTNTLTARGKSATACIRGQINGATAIDFEADFTSMNSGGFTVNVSNGPANNIIVHYLAIGGSDIVNQKCGSVTIPTSGSLAFTDPGFQPDCLILAHTWPDGANYRMSLAAITGASEAYNLHYGQISGSATVQSSTLQKAGAVFSGTTNAFGPDMDIGFVSLDATGFTLGGGTPDYPAATHTLYYLAIEGGQWQAGVDTEGTAASAKDTALDFTPTGLLLFGLNAVSSATYNNSVNGNLTIGAATGIGAFEGCVWNGNDDAHTDNPSFKRHDDTRAYWHATSAAGTAGPPTTDNEANASFASNKFTLTWTQAGSSREFIYLAGGSEPAAADVAPKERVALQAVARASTW